MYSISIISFLIYYCSCVRQQPKGQSTSRLYWRIPDTAIKSIAPTEKVTSLGLDSAYNINIDIADVDPDYVALCAITKDDHPDDLNEWLHYHFAIGIGRIYLIDTGSRNVSLLQFSEYVRSGKLFYSYWSMVSASKAYNMQRDVYHKISVIFARQHQWIGFIDTDEFVVLRNKAGVNNLPEFLQRYEDYGALVANWILFGSSEHQQHQNSVLKMYTKCFLHDHVKIFVNVRNWSLKIQGVHLVGNRNFLTKKYSVDENKEAVPGPANRRFPANQIAIFHYVTKSMEDFEVKIKRGDATGHQARSIAFFDFIEQNSNYTCTEGVQLYEQLFNKNQMN